MPGQPKMILSVKTPLHMFGNNAQPTVDDDDDDDHDGSRAYVILPDGTMVQKRDPHLTLQRRQQPQDQQRQRQPQRSHPSHRQNHPHRRVILPSDQCVFASQSTQTFAKTMHRRLFYDPAEQQEYVQDIALSFPGLPRLTDVVSHRDLAIRHSHHEVRGVDEDDDENDTTTATTTATDDDNVQDDDVTMTIPTVLDNNGPRALAPRYLMPDNNLPNTNGASNENRSRRRVRPVSWSSSPTTTTTTTNQSARSHPSPSSSYSLPDTNMLTLPNRMQYSDHTRTSVVRQSTDHDDDDDEQPSRRPRRLVKQYHPSQQLQQQQQQHLSGTHQQGQPSQQQRQTFRRPRSAPEMPTSPSFGNPAIVAPQNHPVTTEHDDGETRGVVSQAQQHQQQQQMAVMSTGFPMQPAVATPIGQQNEVTTSENRSAIPTMEQQPAVATPLASNSNNIPTPTGDSYRVQGMRHDVDEPDLDEPVGLFDDNHVAKEYVMENDANMLSERIRSGSGWETPTTNQSVQSPVNDGFAPSKQTIDSAMGPVLDTYWGSDAQDDPQPIESSSPYPFTAQTSRAPTSKQHPPPHPIANGLSSLNNRHQSIGAAEAARQKEYFAQRIAESRKLHSGKLTPPSVREPTTVQTPVKHNSITNGTSSPVPSSPQTKTATDITRQREYYAQKIAQSRQLHSGKSNPPPTITTTRQREYFAQRIAQSRQQAWENSCKRREEGKAKSIPDARMSYFAQRIAASRERASQLAGDKQSQE